MQRTDDNEMVRKLWPVIPVQHGIAIFRYNRHSPFHRIMTKIKRHGGHDMAYQLGRWAALETKDHKLEEKVDILVPVPITKERLRERGYNQAERIAQGMGEVMGLPVCDCLTCIRPMKAQKNLNAEERIENTKGHFRADIPPQYMGKRFLLVDDVYTTGATTISCAASILEADDMAEISIFTLAKS